MMKIEEEDCGCGYDEVLERVDVFSRVVDCGMCVGSSTYFVIIWHWLGSVFLERYVDSTR